MQPQNIHGTLYEDSAFAPLVIFLSLGVSTLFAAFAILSGGSAWFWVIAAAALFILLNFYSIRVVIDDESLLISYGVGLVQREIYFAVIQSVYIGSNLHLWSWPFDPFSGDATIIQLRDGKRVAIGFPRRAEMTAELERRRYIKGV